MLLLALDTSGKRGSIALARAGERSGEGDDLDVIDVMPLAGGTFSAELVPQICVLLSRNAFAKQDIGAFAVASGPGSFTGLRIGLAVVKALAEILEKPIVPVSLLELCVFTSGIQGKVMAALDAGRGDFYVGEYEVPVFQPPRETMMTRSEFISQAKRWNVVTSDIMLAETANAAGLSAALLSPLTADDVARLGWYKLQRGETVSPEQLEANYIRRTDAEMLERIGS